MPWRIALAGDGKKRWPGWRASSIRRLEFRTGLADSRDLSVARPLCISIARGAAMWGILRRSRRYAARREFVGFFRPLRIEALESRWAPAILTVNSLADGPVNLTDATVTLRDAIEAANNDVAVSPGGLSGSGADEIRFQAGLTGTITLNENQGQLEIRSNLTITGPGASMLAVSGNDVRVLNVDDGLASERTVTINGLIISDGDTDASSGGGGINNAEKLTIQNCVISGNAGAFVGGIHNSGTLI